MEDIPSDVKPPRKLSCIQQFIIVIRAYILVLAAWDQLCPDYIAFRSQTHDNETTYVSKIQLPANTTAGNSTQSWDFERSRYKSVSVFVLLYNEQESALNSLCFTLSSDSWSDHLSDDTCLDNYAFLVYS